MAIQRHPSGTPLGAGGEFRTQVRAESPEDLTAPPGHDPALFELLSDDELVDHGLRTGALAKVTEIEVLAGQFPKLTLLVRPVDLELVNADEAWAGRTRQLAEEHGHLPFVAALSARRALLPVSPQEVAAFGLGEPNELFRIRT